MLKIDMATRIIKLRKIFENRNDIVLINLARHRLFLQRVTGNRKTDIIAELSRRRYAKLPKVRAGCAVLACGVYHRKSVGATMKSIVARLAS
ncbi:hypothetical protein DSM3645_15120 [Blastopirellula marina DSM 3645]|uniref:Uncharacterized protein n=1 Tax=Blastopirellula marina DSM 3645 TaxID=314230 RepID=A4A243_9BACT|nr:hypothetical protein DSM3645_15120 [Blastopirellula marina DSM 3645]